MAAGLSGVRGVRAVALGGSRARGAHRTDSDWDLGVYYRGGVDVAGLAALAEELTGAAVEVAGPGGWGPWVNGGAWLTVDGVRIDWILRDLDRVESVWADCREGRYEVGVQAGHPLGFWSPAYAGEVALCRVLADPAGELVALRTQTGTYPEPLRKALVDAAWEAEFSVAVAAKSAGARAGAGDPLHVSLCLSRAFGILAQSLHAHQRMWLLNEKGALTGAAALPAAPPDFAARVAGALRGLDASAVAAAGALVREVRGRLV
ncbi:nucleotidyltransferase family protein [Streptomyces sp. FIT100]|uniref:nucleotidyltransferase family protein n=1 Tax=Streptomyces sp. FIT100 TaxID=2837956 RepID=UPI0021C9C54E|nr:nucleotidyltransferase domain-containing protein [Streptomyces sp. FIT100]UUN31516.1 nucleotidyltransferase domain-containing protein [Streptomyces sp. FIT100]